MNDKLENGKDKVVGKIKETTGKLTNDEGLEFAGKLQTITADFGKKIDDVKEDVLENANDFIDHRKDMNK